MSEDQPITKEIIEQMDADRRIKFNEVDVQKLNLQPGEVLVVKVRSDEVSQYDMDQLSSGLRRLFSNNKVIVLAVGLEGSIDLTVAKETEYPEVSYCTDCNCGKKAAYEGDGNETT